MSSNSDSSQIQQFPIRFDDQLDLLYSLSKTDGDITIRIESKLEKNE